MKRFIALFLATVTLAHADNFAETENIGGGKIVLMTDACETDKALSRAYNYTREGKTEDGCWKYDAETVVVFWQTQGKYRYPINNFLLMGAYRKFKTF